jgi:hypothetical protein
VEGASRDVDGYDDAELRAYAEQRTPRPGRRRAAMNSTLRYAARAHGG